MGTWKDVSDRVLPGVDVRAALAAVESAGAQAGIVYRTDAAPSKKVRIVFAVPIDQGPKISYPVAAIAGRRPTRKLAPRRIPRVLERTNGVREVRVRVPPLRPGAPSR